MPAPKTILARTGWGSLLTSGVLLLLYARFMEHFSAGEPGWSAFYTSPSSSYVFWLIHALVALPALMLIVNSLWPLLEKPLERVRTALANLQAAEWRNLSIGFFVALMAVAAFGRHIVLRDLPITDDEHSIVFGADILASGRLMIADESPSFTDYGFRYTYQRDGQITSMDYPGGVLFATAARWMPLLYAFFAAASGLAVAYTAGLLVGPGGRLAAGLLWMFSPMVLFLSITHHAQLVSRSWVAFALMFYVRLTKPDMSRKHIDALGYGLFVGLALLTRPPEALCLLTPPSLHLLWLATRSAAHRKNLLLALLPALACGVLFAAYNLGTTGVWYLPARFAPGIVANDFKLFGPWGRIAWNLGNNLVRLNIWLIGPLLMFLVPLGLSKRNPVTAVLAGGVALNFLLAIAHNDTGIYIVGPIHYSETAVPLVILSAAGITIMLDACAKHRLSVTRTAALLTAYCAVGLSLFSSTHAQELRKQADNQRLPWKIFADAGLRNAVVFSDPPNKLYGMRKELARTGSWVHHFPPPKIDVSDDILVLSKDADVAEARARFPNRSFYRASFRSEGTPLIKLRPLPAAR